MRRLTVVRLCLSVVLLATVAPAGMHAQNSGQKPAADARLSQSVREGQGEGSLSQYLKRLTANTKVPHSVDERFQERGLVALSVDMSLGKLQSAVARVFQLTWRPSVDPPS